MDEIWLLIPFSEYILTNFKSIPGNIQDSIDLRPVRDWIRIFFESLFDVRPIRIGDFISDDSVAIQQVWPWIFKGEDEMLSYIIEGGKRLEGETFVSGSKNASLPIMAASVLNRGITKLYNVPNIHDTQITLPEKEAIF